MKEVLLKIVDNSRKDKILEFNDRVSGFEVEPKGYTMDRKKREPVIDNRISFLQCAGFSGEQINKIAKQREYFYPIHTLYGDIMAYLSMGFDNYQLIMSKDTRGISDGFTMIANKITEIKNIGFSDKQLKKVIYGYPGILQYSIDVIKNKIDGLNDIGFGDVLKMIENNPKVITKDLEAIKVKIGDLELRHFKNPIKFLERNINLSIENIDSKISIIDDLSKKCTLEDTTIDLIESFSAIASSKKEKIKIISLLMESMSSDEMVTTTYFHKMVFSNLENLLIAYSMRREGDKLMDLWQQAKDLDDKKWDNKEKKEMLNFCYKNSKDKIEKRLYKIYKKGYLNEKLKENGEKKN